MKGLLRAILLLAALGGPLRGQDEEGGVEGVLSIGAGAGQIALGRAGVARPEESTALFWNPAYLDQVGRARATFFHTSFLGGTPLDFAGVTIPTLHIGTFGVGLLRIATGEIERTDNRGLLTGEFSFAQEEILFSYGRALEGLRPGLSFGVSLKVERQSLAGESSQGVGLDMAGHYDVGGLHPLLERTEVGAVYRNAVAPSLRLAGTSEEIPPAVTVGVTREIPLRDGSSLFPLYDLVKARDRSLQHRLGVEYRYQPLLAVRGGWSDQGPSTGFGVRYRGWAVDYALRDAALQTQHLVSIAWEFGATRDEMRARETEAEAARVRVGAEEEFRRRREAEMARHAQEAARLQGREEYFAALGEWQQVLAWDAENAPARAAIDSIAKTLDALQQARNLDAATKAATRELFDAGIRSYAEKRYPEAIASWQRVLEIDPGHPQVQDYIGRARAEAAALTAQHRARGEALLRGGNYTGALGEFHTSLRYAPENTDIIARIAAVERRLRSDQRFREGLSLYLQQEYEEALAAFEEALTLNPESELLTEYITMARGRIAGERGGLSPEMEATYLRGVDLYLQGKYAEAIAEWEKVLKAEPGNPAVRRNIDAARERMRTIQSLEKKED